MIRIIEIKARNYYKMLNRTRNSNFQGAVLSIDIDLAYLNMLSTPYFKYLTCQEIFSTTNIAFHYHEKSYMTARIDSLLSQMSASGFIKFSFDSYIDRKYLEYDDFDDDDPKQFSNVDFSGTYQVCGLLIFLAVIVFIIELLTVKFKKLQRVLDYLNSVY